MDETRRAAAYAHCEDLVRRHDHDRWLADLFLPAAIRPHAHALHAFSHEVARIREGVHEALPGEVRQQWWIDAIEGEARGDVAAHPVAAALIDTVHRFSLRRSALRSLVEARRFDLYDDAMPTLRDLEGYAGETSSALFQLLALIVDADAAPGAVDASGHAGLAYAFTGLMRALPLTARRNQVFLPADLLARHSVTPDDVRSGRDGPGLRAALAEFRSMAVDHLGQAEAVLAELPVALKPAFVPLGLVRPYLRRLAKAEPFGRPVDVAGWLKPLHLWRYSRRL
jgi:phytoene synthase